MIVLTLPIPISSNDYWGQRQVWSPKQGRHISMVYVTPEAREYKDSVAWYVRSVGIRAPLAGRVWVDIKLYPNRPQDWAKRAAKDPACWDDTVRRPDLDNCRKVLYDALKGSAFGDDVLVFKDSGEVQEPDEWGARVVVTIRSIVRKSPQQALITEVSDV